MYNNSSFVGVLLAIMVALPAYGMLQDSKLNPFFYSLIAKGNTYRIQQYITKHPEFLNCFSLPERDGRNNGYYGINRVPLNVAVSLNQCGVVKTLVAAGADVNQQDNRAALHEAADKGNTMIIATLLAASRVNINLRENYGHKTPLHIAAAQGYWRVVEMLLRASADAVALDSGHQTPLDIVRDKIKENNCFMVCCCPWYIVHRIYHPEQDYTKTLYLLEEAEKRFENAEII